MGRPYIKSGLIDKDSINEQIRIRYTGDSINFQECINMIIDRINEAEEEKQNAQQAVRKYEEKINADSRVKEIKAKYDEATMALYRGFGISKEESEAITEWKNQHDKNQHGLNSLDKRLQAGGAIGGRYHYQFVPTSIGTIGTCVCGSCESKAFAEAKGDREKYNKLKKKYDAEFDFSEL